MLTVKGTQNQRSTLGGSSRRAKGIGHRTQRWSNTSVVERPNVLRRLVSALEEKKEFISETVIIALSFSNSMASHFDLNHQMHCWLIQTANQVLADEVIHGDAALDCQNPHFAGDCGRDLSMDLSIGACSSQDYCSAGDR